MKKTESIPFRRLLISKDRHLVVVAHAVENNLVMGLGFTAKMPNGFIHEWALNTFDELPIDMLRFIDLYAPARKL